MSDTTIAELEAGYWQARAEAAEARLAAIEAVVGPAKEAVRKATGHQTTLDWEVHWETLIRAANPYNKPVAIAHSGDDAEAIVAAVNAIRALSEADKDRQIAATEREE